MKTQDRKSGSKKNHQVKRKKSRQKIATPQVTSTDFFATAEDGTLNTSAEIVSERGVSSTIGNKNDIDLVPGTDADVTPEDIEALGPQELNFDMGDDEDLKHRIYPVDFAGEDLDVPGAELDDKNEEIGSEDEENNAYSLGGDNHDD